MAPPGTAHHARLVCLGTRALSARRTASKFRGAWRVADNAPHLAEGSFSVAARTRFGTRRRSTTAWRQDNTRGRPSLSSALPSSDRSSGRFASAPAPDAA